MKGNIYTDQRCPLCGKILQHNERKQAVLCPDHPEVRASRFRVQYGRKVMKRFKDYAQAARFLNTCRCDDDRGLFDPRDYRTNFPLGFETQAKKWLKVKAQQVKPNSYRDIKRDMDKAIVEWGQTNCKLIQYAQIEDWLLAMKVGDKTRFNARATLGQFFGWLQKREGIPAPEMPEINYELGWRNIIDMQTQARVLAKIKEMTWERNPRIWIGIKWLADYIAIRPGEMRALRERDIDVNGFLVIPSPKEKSPKLVPMLDEDIELYRSLPRGFPDLFFFRHSNGKQFAREMFWRNWIAACKEVGVKGVDLYGGTRHSTASALGEHFTKDELRDSGTMHATNKAFERYMQHKAQPSRDIYQAAGRLRRME